jgi:hypothetical protein
MTRLLALSVVLAVGCTTPLHEAVVEGDLEELEERLESGEPTSARSKAMMQAIDDDNVEAVRVLHRYGVPTRSEYFRRAVEGNEPRTLAYMLSTDEPFSDDDLDAAIEAGGTDLIQALLERGATPGAHSANQAIARGYTELLESFLDAGLDPNIEMPVDYLVITTKSNAAHTIEVERGSLKTLLGTAVLHGDIEAVKLLIAHGSDPNQQYVYRRARNLSPSFSDETLRDMVGSRGVDFEGPPPVFYEPPILTTPFLGALCVKPSRAMAPLELGAYRRAVRRMLLDAGADSDRRDSLGRSASDILETCGVS